MYLLSFDVPPFVVGGGQGTQQGRILWHCYLLCFELADLSGGNTRIFENKKRHIDEEHDRF